MIDPTVRPGSDGDIHQLVALEADARTGLVGHRGGDRWLADHPALGDRWVGSLAAGDVFVAVIDEVVVGYIVGGVDGTVATVDGVYVDPEARECGFGSALLDAFIDAAAQRGATVIDGHALPGDRETKNLYERAGITARLIIVSAPIPRPPITS